MSKVHETELRVRYQETDSMGVVYYANYLVWFEVARTEHFKSFGVSYRDMEADGLYLMVAGVTCQYKSPARYDDLVRVESWVPEVKNSSLKFGYKLFVGDRLIATGESVHVFTNKSGKPIRVPQNIRELCAARGE